MRIARSKNSKKNDQTINDFDENFRIDLKNHLQQDTNDVHFRDSLDFDICLDDVTHVKEQENRHRQQIDDFAKQMFQNCCERLSNHLCIDS